MASDAQMDRMLQSYGLDSARGFAAGSDPMPTRFQDDIFNSSWLSVASRLSTLIASGALRAEIDTKIPILSPERLVSLQEYRLAYVVLCLLANAYIWDHHSSLDDSPGSTPTNYIPPCIAVPLLEIAEELECPPALCFAALTLWNRVIRVDNAGQPQEQCVALFTGTKDEEHFNLTGYRVEVAGGAALKSALLATRHVAKGDVAAVITSLNALEAALKTCKAELVKMKDKLDPDVFYFKIRPYFFGSQNVEEGVRYRTDPDDPSVGEIYKLPGATAGQSSLFQALDVILGISHENSPRRLKFIQEMRRSMPGDHLRFLNDITALPSIVKFVDSRQDASLSESYSKAVTALKEIRDEHIKIVTLYILNPSKRDPALRKENVDSRPAEESAKGTGGSDLFALLKGMRDDTKASIK